MAALLSVDESVDTSRSNRIEGAENSVPVVPDDAGTLGPSRALFWSPFLAPDLVDLCGLRFPFGEACTPD